ncbi:hypothetical protein OHB07_30135 [Streptomyces sp. NBC_00111]|uniref:hypothetical protein n=1 Tax=unclassified Streptomyces TaxID=2593676 RepID=UPI002E302E69|nr:hypothetical protein [Streptomyces sp. NBC_01460]
MRRDPAPEGGRSPSRRALLAAAVATPAAGFAAALTADAPDTGPAGRPADGKGTGGPAAAGGTPWPPERDDGPGEVFRPVFPVEGLVTNEYAHSHPDSGDARLSDDWAVTSGSLFAHWAFGWTGVPDGGSPGPGSAPHTGSSVFRLVTRRRDFGDTTVRCWVFLKPPGTTGRTPAQAWDGGHLWLRYRSPQELYALSFRRRDGAVVLKRKYPAPGRPEGEEGVYTALAAGEHAVAYGRWHQVSATVRGCDADRVRITLALNGRTVLDAQDRTPGRLATPGGIGLRGDNTEMAFFGFTARGGPGRRQCTESWDGGDRP